MSGKFIAKPLREDDLACTSSERENRNIDIGRVGEALSRVRTKQTRCEPQTPKNYLHHLKIRTCKRWVCASRCLNHSSLVGRWLLDCSIVHRIFVAHPTPLSFCGNDSENPASPGARGCGDCDIGDFRLLCDLRQKGVNSRLPRGVVNKVD